MERQSTRSFSNRVLFIPVITHVDTHAPSSVLPRGVHPVRPYTGDPAPALSLVHPGGAMIQ